MDFIEISKLNADGNMRSFRDLNYELIHIKTHIGLNLVVDRGVTNILFDYLSLSGTTINVSMRENYRFKSNEAKV